MIVIEYYLKESTILKKRYRVVEPLGKGGFGLTYKCMDLHRGEFAAIKEFFPRGSERGDALEVIPGSADLREAYYDKLSSFSEEFRIISTISDIHVVKVLDFFTENNTAYYVMEFISGMNLKDYGKHNGRLDQKRAFEIIDDILKGVASIHESGYIHGDLKPTNVMLTDDGKIKVMDFGAACLKDTFYSYEASKVVSMSYACPEKFFASSTPELSWDIYSVGGILYFLLSGIDPIPATDRVRGIPLELSMISRKPKAIIEKSMALVATRRFRDTAHFRKAINGRLFL